MKVASILQAQVEVGRGTTFPAVWDVSPVVATLEGDKCEWIPSKRGMKVPVVPLKHLGGDLWAWLRYQEEWAYDPGAKKSTTKLIFRSASTAIHFGLENDLYKPQMFRLEWAGWANWNGAAFGYQGGDAGHPHWQFDALESLFKTDARERADTLRKKLKDDSSVQDFAPQYPVDDTWDLLSVRNFDRIHFASAAAWWKKPPCDDHAHTPKNPQELQAWLCKSLSYLSSELGHLNAA